MGNTSFVVSTIELVVVVRLHGIDCIVDLGVFKLVVLIRLTVDFEPMFVGRLIALFFNLLLPFFDRLKLLLLAG